MKPDALKPAARLLARRLDELGRVSDDDGRLTRTFLSPAMRRANAVVGGWMKEAGLTVHEDAVGNLIGRLEATAVGSPLAGAAGARASSLAYDQSRTKTLLLGSHLDTVRDAGRFDGALGVLLPIVALAELRRRGVALPFAVEVLGFSEEEGVRFASAYLGSKGFTGQLRAADLKLKDAAGVSVGEAIEGWNASPPALSGRSRMHLGLESLHLAQRQSNLMGYFEVHIEQGPVLEAEDLAVGVVSAIAGQTRAKLSLVGKAGHAGTTPMALRRDALTGAAEFALMAEALARKTPGLVATVGSIAVAPGAANVIPASAVFTLDVRHARDAGRRAALRKLAAFAKKIAARRKLELTWQTTQENGAVACAPALSDVLEASVRARQGRSRRLVSGAGHDAVVVAAIAPVAMLFVRCRDGLSHHPDEYASPADLETALRVTVDFLERLALAHSR